MVAVIVVAVGFGLLTALVLNRPFQGRTMARGMMTLPWAFPDVATVLVFIWMLNPNFGVINLFATWMPFIGPQKWLLNPHRAMTWVVLIDGLERLSLLQPGHFGVAANRAPGTS